jgi:hypothetical protein
VGDQLEDLHAERVHWECVATLDAHDQHVIFVLITAQEERVTTVETAIFT